MGDYNNIMGQYQNFAKTGGYSPMELASIRSRAVSPTQAAYQRGMQGISRQRSLQGGYSPGANVAIGRLGREAGQAGSDAATNAEAMIAQMVNQGRQFGTQGQASLYGTTPGATSMFGNQVLEATIQLAGAVGNEMGFGNQVAQNTISAGQLPGKGDYALSRIGQIATIGAGVLGGLSGLGQSSTGWQFPGRTAPM